MIDAESGAFLTSWLLRLALATTLLCVTGCHTDPSPNEAGDVIAERTAVDVQAFSADVADVAVADLIAPTWPAGASLDAIGGIDRMVFRWPSATDNIAVTAYRVRRMDGSMQLLAANVREFVIDGLALDVMASLEVTAQDAAGNESLPLRATAVTGVPDPARIAPPIGPFEGGPTARATRFLFEANPPLQLGVMPGAIEDQRIAVLRGRVIDRAGLPVRRARVTVLAHSEFGY